MQQDVPMSATSSKVTLSTLGSPISQHNDGSVEKLVNADNETPTFPDGGLRAWTVALGASGVCVCTAGYVTSFGVFQQYYQARMLSHKTPSTIAWIGSVQVFFFYGAALQGGPLFDRFGSLMLWPPAFLFIISLALTSILSSYTPLILIQGALSGTTCGILMCAALTSSSHHFLTHRYLVLGMNAAGGALGGVLTPLILGRLLYHHNLSFRLALQIYALVNMSLLFASCAAIRARLPLRKGFVKCVSLSAFSEPCYAILVLGCFLMILAVFIPLFYAPIHARQYGVSEALSTYLLSILNSASFFGRLLPGFLTQRFGCQNLLCGAGVAAALVLFFWHHAHTEIAIMLVLLLYGFFSGAIMALAPCVFASRARRAGDVGLYMGMGLCVSAFGALVGPPIVGVMVRHYGGWREAVWTCGGSLGVGGLLVLGAKWFGGEGVLSWS